MTKVRLNVIIPVYNVEGTLDRCLKSIVDCRLPDMEILLVDDGSTDRSGTMCDEWQQRDPRISVIHKANGGLSDARNCGIDHSTGDYITFVDSDDYLSAGTLEALMSLAAAHPDYDMIEYGMCIHEGGHDEHLLTFSDQEFADVNRYWLDLQVWQHTYACNKLYRRGLFEEVRFPKGRVFEDAYTLPHVLRKAHVVATTGTGFYHYCDNAEGITAKADGHALAMLLGAHLQGGMPVDDNYYLYLLNIQMDVCELTGGAPLLPDRHINTSTLAGKNKLKAFVFNTLGIKQLCKISQLLHRIKKPSRS